MIRLMMLASAAAFGIPAAASAPPSGGVALNCDLETARAGGEAPNLHGHWDFLMVPRGIPSFGLMSIGFVGAGVGVSVLPRLAARALPASVVRLDLAPPVPVRHLAALVRDVGAPSPAADRAVELLTDLIARPSASSRQVLEP